MNKYDWDAVRLWYLANEDASLEKTCVKFSIPKKTLFSHAKNAGWAAAKRELKKQLSENGEDEHAECENEKIASLAYAADLAVERITRILSQPADDENDKSDTKNLKDCVSVLKDLTAIIRNVNDIQTPAQAQSQRIEQEKWELEKSKQTESAKKDDIRVFFESEGDEEK